jgi:hypothetical protein
VVHVRIDVSEERIASIFGVKIISELGTKLAVTRELQLLVIANVVPIPLILVTLMMKALYYSETSDLTRDT